MLNQVHMLAVKNILNINYFVPDNIINYFIYTILFNLCNYCWKVIMTG